jgi:UDP-N-acetylmuramate dehydrogenase
MTPQTDVRLAPLCTMGVGGAARWFVSAHTDSDVCDALRWARSSNVAVSVLGGGSNVVIADEGIDGLVIHVNVTGRETRRANASVEYRVGAGEPWDPFVASTLEDGCGGVECLSGIPGFVGGTPVQNVGAYGQDVSSTITAVHVVERTSGAPRVFANAECRFGYRTSRFKHADRDRYIVTAVEFSLPRDARPTVQYADVVAYLAAADISNPSLDDVRDAVLAIRRRKGMVIEEGNAANKSCGSFFVNPIVTRDDLARTQAATGIDAVPHYVIDTTSVKIPAAWLIEHAGFPKGTTRGPVGISPFQAQAIVNLGAAQAADVVALAADVKRAVWNTFGISIVPEPVFMGFAPSSELKFLVTHHRSS